jgi:hypothetical protein
MSSSSSLDTAFKVAALVSSLVIVPMFAWVWSTNEKVQEVSVELTHIKEQVGEMKSNSTDIKLIQRDIEYIKEHIKLIKESLSRD